MAVPVLFPQFVFVEEVVVVIKLETLIVCVAVAVQPDPFVTVMVYVVVIVGEIVIVEIPPELLLQVLAEEQVLIHIHGIILKQQ